MYAVLSGCLETTLVLVNSGSDILHQDNDGMDALMHAAANVHEMIVRLVIHEQGANIHRSCLRGNTALFYAVLSACKETVKLLVEAHMDLSDKRNDVEHFIGHAYENKQYAIVRILIDSQNSSLTDNESMTHSRREKINQYKIYDFSNVDELNDQIERIESYAEEVKAVSTEVRSALCSVRADMKNVICSVALSPEVLRHAQGKWKSELDILNKKIQSFENCVICLDPMNPRELFLHLQC